MSGFYREDGTPRTGRFVGAIALAVVVLVTGVVALFGLKKTPQSQVGISYGGGVVEGQHFQRIVEPGHGLFFNGLADKLYRYPATQRNYIISLREGEGDVGRPDSIKAPTDDNVVAEWEVAVYFKLNLDRLQEFHEDIGLKYHAWCSGEDTNCSDGWVDMLHASFRQQIEQAVQFESRQFLAKELYSDEDVLIEVQRSVGTVLRERVAEVLGGDYFCGPGYVSGGDSCPDFEFVVKRVTLPDDVTKAFERNRTSEIEIETRQNEVSQAELQAAAIAKLAQALQDAGPSYTLLKAIESGRITFWVLNGQGLTLPAPQQAD